ncbi:MAG: leucine-rich repeat protein [Clostridia bacterium]|nr:leucine-rich repeat protein [Clostridia bacterium]
MDVCYKCQKKIDQPYNCSGCGKVLPLWQHTCPDCGRIAPWHRLCPYCGNDLTTQEERMTAGRGGSKNISELFRSFEYVRHDDGTFTVTGLKDRLAMRLNVPAGTVSITAEAFKGCGFLDVSLPEGLLIIEPSAFENCYRLRSVSFPEGIYAIEENAFKGCKGLRSVTFPSSLAIIGDGAFMNCSSLSSPSLPDEVEIGIDAFKGTKNTEAAANPTISRVTDPPKPAPASPETRADKPSAATPSPSPAPAPKHTPDPTPPPSPVRSTPPKTGRITTDDRRLLDLLILEKLDDGTYKINGVKTSKRLPGAVNIPENVSVIGEQAFYERDDITELTLPSSVKEISDSAFGFCSNLKTARLHCSATALPDHLFFCCDKLEAVSLPEALTDIKQKVFYNCSALTTVNLPDTLKTIGEAAFGGCDKLREILIPANVTKIGKNVFASCASLEKIGVTATNTRYCSENGALYTKDKKTLLRFPPASRKYAGLKETVTSIDDGAFQGCTFLHHMVIFPAVSYIGDGAFSECQNLTEIVVMPANRHFSSYDSVLFTRDKKTLLRCPQAKNGKFTIPNGVETIAKLAFEDCKNITGIDLPSTLTTIDYLAFSGCSSMKTISIPRSVTAIGFWAFNACDGLEHIYCRARSKPTGWDDQWLGISVSPQIHWGK